ncbi:MAG: NADH-quinone oxidoreductase subunit J [Candidatus Omnitrophica bacterium]|nr:NADH-quinone oxidoreductase subunit J [Candidatus Omnitrophota bacterium]
MAAFVLFALVILTGAVWVVTLRNLFRAALSLGLVLFGVAGVFLLLEAEFLAFAQILVYVGAILTLLVFAIMLTARAPGAQPAATSPPTKYGPISPGTFGGGASRQQGPAALAAAAVFVLLTWATWRLPWPAMPADHTATLPALGQRLVTAWVLPFEVISLVFVAVITGAVAIAAPRRGRQN